MGDGSDSGDASDGNLGIPLAPGRAPLRDTDRLRNTPENPPTSGPSRATRPGTGKGEGGAEGGTCAVGRGLRRGSGGASFAGGKKSWQLLRGLKGRLGVESRHLDSGRKS